MPKRLNLDLLATRGYVADLRCDIALQGVDGRIRAQLLSMRQFCFHNIDHHDAGA